MSNKTLMTTYLAKRAELEFLTEDLDAKREVLERLECTIRNTPSLTNILGRDGVLAPCGQIVKMEGGRIVMEWPDKPVYLEELDNVSGDMYG